jgi:hypothetical protein
MLKWVLVLFFPLFILLLLCFTSVLCPLTSLLALQGFLASLPTADPAPPHKMTYSFT